MQQCNVNVDLKELPSGTTNGNKYRLMDKDYGINYRMTINEVFLGEYPKVLPTDVSDALATKISPTDKPT